MALPVMTGTGRLTADPELRWTPSGVAVGTVRLAFNSRKYNKQTNEWEDGDVFFVDGTVFQAHAENLADEDLRKGVEVVVTGRLKTDQWRDKNTGENRSKSAMLIDSIGRAVPRFVQQGQQTQGGYAQTQTDPWAGSQPQQQAFDQEAPF